MPDQGLRFDVNPSRDHQRKDAPFAGLALNLDFPAKDLGQVSGDSQAQSCGDGFYIYLQRFAVYETSGPEPALTGWGDSAGTGLRYLAITARNFSPRIGLAM